MVWLHVERVLQFSILWQLQFHVSRFGVRIPVKAIFCDVTPMAIHTNQSIKTLKKIFSIDWPLQKVGKRKKPKKWSRLGFEPQTWRRRTVTATVCWITAHVRHAVKPCCRQKQGKRSMIAYCFTQCSNGCSLGSLLFPGQDNHVQRCTYVVRTCTVNECSYF